MEKTLLYIRAEAVSEDNIKDMFEFSDIIFYVADTAKEAFDIMNQQRIMVVLADCYIKDMKILDFIKYSVKNHPETALNVCLDITDPNMITNIANIKEIKKIYMAPWNLLEIEEGIKATIDQQLIDSDFYTREQTLSKDEEELKREIETLTKVIQKQRDGYNRMSLVLKPYLEQVIKMMPSVKASGGEMSAEDNLYYNLIKRTCEKMLRIMSAGALDADKLKMYMTEDITRGLPQSGRIKLKSIDSCIVGSHERDRLGLVVFAVWLISVYQSYRLAAGEITIDSFYLEGPVVRYQVTALGKENTVCPQKVHGYVEKAVEYVCKDYRVEVSGDKVKYSMDFEI